MFLVGSAHQGLTRMKEQSPENLVWLDMEMSGLDVEKESILEIATVVTDGNLKVIEEGPNLIVHQDEAVLLEMDGWNQKHHSASGLIEKVRRSKLTVKDVEQETLEFVQKYCPEQTSPLCGNSIGQDRKFLYKHMRTFHDYLHYRNIDVTSVKELIARWYPNGPELPTKSEEHKALVDVKESIEELEFYRRNYFILPGSMGSA